MKKLLLMAVMAVRFMGCSIIPRYQLNSYTVDYSKYNKYNFFITESNSVNFEYTSIGSIVTESVTGKMYKDGSDIPNQVEDYGFDAFTALKYASIDDAFQKLYEESVKKGANGVINVKMEFHNSYQDPISKTVYMSRWIVTGMMIKK